MRVSVIGPAPPLRGGIAAHTAGLCGALERAGHRISVLSYARLYPRLFFPGTSQCTGDGAAVGVALLDTLDPASWRRARRWLAESAAELIVVQWWHPVVAPALAVCLDAREPASVLLVCHNARPHEHLPGWRMLRALAMRKADGFLFHSQAVRQELHPAITRGRPSLTCPMPVLLDVAGRLPTPAQARARLAFDDAGPVVLCLGHARRYKGIPLLLRAWDRARVPPRAVLVLAGESYLGPGKLQAEVARLDRARSVRIEDRYLPDQSVRDLLAAADVLVLPHLQASQSGVLPLALAAGLTVVASDAGGLSEALPQDAGHHVFRAGDAGALTEALEASLERVASGRPMADAALRHGCDRPASDKAASWEPVVAACERFAAASGRGDLAALPRKG